MRRGRFSQRWFVIAVLFALGCATAAGALLFYEGFDYPTGSLAGQNGGIGFASAWGSGTVVASGLSYPDANNAQLSVAGRA